MRTLAALLLALPAAASPMLDKCLPVAPASCKLDEKSKYADFLSCFAPVTLDEKDPKQAACAPELLHAKVHQSCDPVDIPTVCKGVKPGADRVMTCLRKNAKALSEPCRKALEGYDGWYKAHAPVKKGRRSAVSAVRC